MPSRFRYSLLGAHFTRSCDVIDYVTNRFAIGHFLVVVHWNRSFISCRLKIFAWHNWVTILTFLGHVTISVTWPLDSPYPISYPSSIVTKPLSPALFEILGPKDNWVTTLTFLGHVTSSIMWPIDSSYAIYYWLSIDTEALYLNVFEIFDPKVPCAHTHSFTHSLTDTRCKWFYILSHAMHCIGQTKT